MRGFLQSAGRNLKEEQGEFGKEAQDTRTAMGKSVKEGEHFWWLNPHQEQLIWAFPKIRLTPLHTQTSCYYRGMWHPRENVAKSNHAVCTWPINSSIRLYSCRCAVLLTQPTASRQYIALGSWELPNPTGAISTVKRADQNQVPHPVSLKPLHLTGCLLRLLHTSSTQRFFRTTWPVENSCLRKERGKPVPSLLNPRPAAPFWPTLYVL